MKVIADNIWLCDDCAIAACNDDYSGMDDQQEHATRRGLADLPYLVCDFNSETGDGLDEFSSRHCDCCSGLAGSRHRFAQLGEDEDDHASLIAQDGWEDDGERGRR